MARQLGLHEILTELHGAQNKWVWIGLALGLNKCVVDGISEKNNLDSLREVLSKVLDLKPLTWRKLIDVLRSKTVSELCLANELAEKFCKPLLH